MKFRDHRGSLTESMATVIDIPPTLEALKIIINTELGKYGVPEISDEMITVESYGFDNRIGWDTHIVIVNGYGVYGYIDGPISSITESNP